MERLSGLDAGFLAMETSTSFMHVGSLMVLDTSTATGRFDFDAIHDLYAARLHLAPPFRRRIVEVPLGLHHPVWIEDPAFDLDRHLRHIAVPSPGDMGELCELTGHLMAIPLDRTRPLWETWLIEGLDDGRVAVLTKVHHAAIDGAAGEELMVALLDDSPDAPIPLAIDPWVPEPIPSDAQLVAHALADATRAPLQAAANLRDTVDAGTRLRDASRSGSHVSPPAPFSAPRTSFNATLSSRRSYAVASLPLDDVKGIARRGEATVNDVVLAVCAGALRRYLDSRSERPSGPLVAMVPFSTRQPRADSRREQASDGPEGGANQISPSLTSLATDVDDPAERLAAIKVGMGAAKELQRTIGPGTFMRWADLAPPILTGSAATAYSRLHVADRHNPLFNLTISNVPGPAMPLYLAGARVDSIFPIGPMFHGSGLNITTLRYRDRIDVGFLTCSDLLPNPWALARFSTESLVELAEAPV